MGDSQKVTHMARGVAFATIGAACWGFSATCIQLLVANWDIPVEWAVAVRLAFAGPTFLLLAILFSRHELRAVFHDKAALGHIVAFGFVGVLALQLSYFSCAALTNAGTATTLERLALIFILVWICIRTPRKPFPQEVIGVTLALIGVVIISTQGNLGALSLPLPGLLMGFLAALCMAGYVLIPGAALEKYGSFVVTALGMSFGGIVLNLIVRPWDAGINITPEIVWVIFLLVALGTVAAYAFYMQGIKDCGPVPAGMLACVEPVSAIVISALWLGTPVTVWDIIGCVLIIIMVLIVTQTTAE